MLYVCSILKIFTSAHPGCGGFSAEDRMKKRVTEHFLSFTDSPSIPTICNHLDERKEGCVCVGGGGWSSKAGVYLKALVNQENTVDS